MLLSWVLGMVRECCLHHCGWCSECELNAYINAGPKPTGSYCFPKGNYGFRFWFVEDQTHKQGVLRDVSMIFLIGKSDQVGP